MRVVLASGSPQRREILERLGVDFEVVVSGVEELTGGEPEVEALENARRKARAVAARMPGRVVIGCDTDVVVDGGALGKPVDEAQAREHLRLLSGRAHEVLSGLVVLGEEERCGLERSTVAFRRLGEDAIERYLRSGEWRERAGGYAIQGFGSTLVERVEGDISNVIGLPVGLLAQLAPQLLEL